MSNRPGMKLGERELPVAAEMLQLGAPAPDFRLTANDWSIKTLADYDGEVKLISVVPSLDTRVCAAQTRRFNQEAAGLSSDVVILTISADLPYAQRRWCAAEGIDRVFTLSDHKDMNFATAYGVHVTDLRITQRSVFVLDRQNVVQYAEYVYLMGDEPTYEAALAKARELV
ncbi:MAG: thiol peroxidase [bacterium]|nr:thiol peroxidase [bacterium]